MSHSIKQENDPVSPIASVRWPLIVVTLLAGHMLLMMVAVVWSRTIPAAVTPIDKSAVETIQGPPIQTPPPQAESP